MSSPKQAIVLESKRDHYVRAALPGLGLLGALLAIAAFTTPVLFAMLPPCIAIAILIGVYRASRPRRGTLAGLGHVDDRGLWVGSELIASRDALQSGTLAPAAQEGPTLQLSGHGMGVDVVVDSVEEGRSMLQALSLDVRHAAAKFRGIGFGAAGYRARLRGVMIGVVGMVVAGFLAGLTRSPMLVAIGFPLVILPIIFTAITMSLPVPIIVGADGIVVQRPFARRFISFDGVDRVEIVESSIMTSTMVSLRLLGKTGTEHADILVGVAKQVTIGQSSVESIRANALSIAERIREALELRSESPAPFDAAALARGGRPVDLWVRKLRELLESAETFRDAAPPTRAALLSVVEDVTVPAPLRAAAAVAVGSADDEARARIRVAADATAAPKLRVALEAACGAIASDESTDDKLAEAMAELEEAETESHAER